METLKIPQKSLKTYKIPKCALLGDEIPKVGQPVCKLIKFLFDNLWWSYAKGIIL